MLSPPQHHTIRWLPSSQHPANFCSLRTLRYYFNSDWTTLAVFFSFRSFYSLFFQMMDSPNSNPNVEGEASTSNATRPRPRLQLQLQRLASRRPHSLLSFRSFSLSMFTPPPSPLPPRRKSPPSPLSQQVDLSSDELEYSPYEDDDSQPSTPIYAELSEKASTPPPIRVPPGPSRNSAKSARRRILIPLVAIVLVLVAAASSRYDVNLKWRTPSTSTERPQPPSADVPVAGFGAESGEHVAGHSHDPNRTSRSPGTHGHNHHHNRKPRIGLSNHWNPTPSSTTSEEFDKRGADELDAVQLAADTTSPSIPDPPYPVPTPFPQAFDTTFSYNFTTSSCQSWFANSLLANLTFRQCRPLSLLLPSSTAFFQAQSNLTTLTAVIGGTCATVRSADDCAGTMSWLASEIQKDTVCGLDLKAKNAMALEALNGFRSYGFMREAGTLFTILSTTRFCKNANSPLVLRLSDQPTHQLVLLRRRSRFLFTSRLLLLHPPTRNTSTKQDNTIM